MVDSTSLENWTLARVRRFESCPLRLFGPLMGVSRMRCLLFDPVCLFNNDLSDLYRRFDM